MVKWEKILLQAQSISLSPNICKYIFPPNTAVGFNQICHMSKAHDREVLQISPVLVFVRKYGCCWREAALCAQFVTRGSSRTPGSQIEGVQPCPSLRTDSLGLTVSGLFFLPLWQCFAHSQCPRSPESHLIPLNKRCWWNCGKLKICTVFKQIKRKLVYANQKLLFCTFIIQAVSFSYFYCSVLPSSWQNLTWLLQHPQNQFQCK